MRDGFIKILAIASPGTIAITTLIQHINIFLQFTGLLVSVVGGGVLFYCEYRNKKLLKTKLEAEINDHDKRANTLGGSV